MKIIERKLSSLIEAEYNPRQLTDVQFQQIKDSITRFGFVEPILVNMHKDRRHVIIGGHQRVRVARDMGLEVVPAIEVKLTLDKERELNVRLNKNTGDFDVDLLANHFDMEELLEWGFSDVDLTGFDTPADPDPDPDPEPIIELSVKVMFASKKDMNAFYKLVGQQPAKTIWYQA